MLGSTLDAVYGVPDEDPMVQVFYANGGPLIGEITAIDKKLTFTVYSGIGVQPHILSVDELEHVFSLARDRLM